MDEKYLVDGRSVTVIATLPDGRFLVDPLYEYDDQDYPADAPFIVDHIFDAAPTNKLNKDVERLNREIKELRETRHTIEMEIITARKQNEASLKDYARFDELKLLNDFIAGKITHYFEIPHYGSPRIIKLSETKTDEYNRGEFRLLSLFGRSDGHLDWKLNAYYDGSGSWNEVIPCTSYEQALVEAQKYLDSQADAKTTWQSTIDFAQKYGLRLPDGYIEREKEDQRKSLLHQMDEAQKRIEEINAKLEAL
jgi:hypothetical protein